MLQNYHVTFNELISASILIHSLKLNILMKNPYCHLLGFRHNGLGNNPHNMTFLIGIVMSQTKNGNKRLYAYGLRFLCTTFFMGTITTLGYDAVAQTQTAQNCQDISDPELRLSCYDNLFAQPTSNTTPPPMTNKPADAVPVLVTPPREVPSALPPAAPKPNVDSFGVRNKNDVLTRPVAPKRTAKRSIKTAPEEITSLTQKVAKLDMFGYKKLRITLENGQVWEQIGSVTNRPPKMSSKRPLIAEIKKAALGSFSLQFNGKGRAIKVKRVR